ncbi:MAG: hypothetical protein WC712_00245 [Candidatus Brocadiia bacterium]
MTKQLRRNFGDIALEKKYVTEANLKTALELQKKQRTVGRYPMIGLILLRMGVITSTQLIEIICEMERSAKPEEGK